MSQEIRLEGCTPTPLAAYLKALGLLRLVYRVDSEVRGCWRDGCFVLIGRLDEGALSRHLLDEYEPTPLVSPWNGGSGFFKKDNHEALDGLRGSSAARFASYRAVILSADEELAPFGTSESPKDGEEKLRLVTTLRARLPDTGLDWLDAALLLTDDAVRFPPLLGTGGNDGRLDFTNNFMQRLVELFDATTGRAKPPTSDWLVQSLFGRAAPGLISKAVGQFSPGRVGGPNAGNGFDSDSLVNPWDFVLMLEGTLPFAAGATRRHEDERRGGMSFPFSVRPFGAGTGQSNVADEGPGRAEMWFPTWERPLGFPELVTLLREGRVTLGRRPPRDGLEFARAVHRLGVDRGLSGFQRYSFLKRSGKAYLAVPLGRVRMGERPEEDHLADLDRENWLARFHRIAKADRSPARLRVLAQRLDDSLFELGSGQARVGSVQSCLVTLGAVQSWLARSPKVQEEMPPVPRLGAGWALDADDASTEFRIAAALAGLSGEVDCPLPTRVHLWPIDPTINDWVWRVRKDRTSDAGSRNLRLTAWSGDLLSGLCAVMERRLWLAQRLELRDKPTAGCLGLEESDLAAFLERRTDDSRIAALLAGLALCELPQAFGAAPSGQVVLPAAFGVLKLVVTRDAELRRLSVLPEANRVPVPPGLLRWLQSGASERAVRAGVQRLCASGVALRIGRSQLPSLPRGLGPRAAAALLMPLSFSATAAMARRLAGTESEIGA